MPSGSHTIDERVIALGGLFLATSQVDQIARNGMVDQAAFETSIRSLFIETPEETIDVYGTANMLNPGLQSLSKHLKGDRADAEIQVIRYSLALLQLERKLNKNSSNLARIGEGIEQAQRQVDHFSICHSSVIAKLADIYSEVVSPVTPRIIVKGSDGHLQNPENANKSGPCYLQAYAQRCSGASVEEVAGNCYFSAANISIAPKTSFVQVQSSISQS